MLSDHRPFLDRRDAGRQLAAALTDLKPDKPVVLALPRGGVPVGYEVALALDAPLDVLIVRKIGAPGHPELGLGAVVDGQHPQRVLNDAVMQQVRPSPEYIEAEERRQLVEIERRRQLYCGDRPPIPIEGRTVIVVDDGIATGGTMKTALVALSQAGVKHLTFAVPVAPMEVVEELQRDIPDGICLLAPEYFRAVSLYYTDFAQTTDEEVVALLDSASQREPAADAVDDLGPGSELDAVPPDASRDRMPPDANLPRQR
ncbi:MAG TPA: phosphoribosyltransferase [Noviherbaspirillum sp.]|nr:phosphoribosyltransferase [Noviherbaspirillum sp.]